MSYKVILSDNSISSPFAVPKELLDTLANTFSERGPQLARPLFDFLSSKIAYGSKKRQFDYANATEVIRNKEGVCGEMSFLYVTCARFLDIPANYVSVKVDHVGKQVHHACAGVFLPKLTLVDIAYRRFNAAHQRFEVLSDAQVSENYQKWRRNNYKPQITTY